MARIAKSRRSRLLPIFLCIAVIASLGSVVSPAMGGPTTSAAAGGALKTAKRALGLAKQADRRSKLALKRAGVPGPQGPQGPPGARGAEGFDGDDGARGPKGATGPIGPIGATGHAGATGPAGATGATGATGSDGATGPAGPTASRSVSTGTAADISTSTTVLDLSSGPLAISFGGRIMATATVQVRNPDAATKEARCRLQVIDAVDPAAVATDMSRTYSFDLPAEADFDTTVTISGAVSKPAGTYNVSLVCGETGSAALSAERANLQVWAAD